MSQLNYNIDNIPTYVALPMDALHNNTLDKPEQFQIIKNAIIKTLSDGSLCIIDANELNEADPQNQVAVTYLPPFDTTQTQNTTPENPQTTTTPEKSSNPIYKCPKCKEVFEKIALYRKHMLWHRNVKKFKCEKCSAGYNVETNLKIHMAMHTEGRPTCPICNISFQRLASLKSHLMLHQVEELYTCEECGAEFEKEEELNKHSQNHLNNTIQENNLVCSYCNVQFEDRRSYKEHISHHVKVKKMVLSGKKSRKTNGTKNYPHVCSVCLKSFSKLSLLERHLRVHSGERPFICEHCNKGFNQKGTLQIHLSKHTGIKPFQCTLCSAKFNQKGNLRVHVEKTHTAPMPGVKMYKCPHCTCIFKKIASLNVHITKCHANNEDLGDIGSVMNKLKELEEQSAVLPHMKEAEKEIAEQNKKVLNDIKKGGDVGNVSYVRLAESFLDGTVRRYLVMQRRVKDTKVYICSYCNKEFKKPSDLIRHTRVHTREKPFSCKQCGASFALKSTLFYHVKTHVGNNNFFCVICMKKFASARSVNMHLRKHAAKSQYQCLPCNKWFTSVQKAKLHNTLVHSQVDSPKIELKPPLLHTPDGLLPVAPPKSPSAKQFQCPICSVKFSKMPNLKRHMLQHNGERKFKCDQCLKSYFTARALKDHQLRHTGVRNYSCKVCAKRFMTSSVLKRHASSHSTSKLYVCPYCNKNFKTLALCQKHINVHKKEISLQIQNESIETDKSVTTDSLLSQQPITNTIQLVAQEPEIKSILADSVININQLYEITPNSIQIIPNKDIQDPNQVQTVYINCEDLQLPENLYPQNTDTLLFNSLSDNTFSIDPLNEEEYNISNEETNTRNKNLNDNILTNTVPYYPQSELNLLFNLDSELNLNLPDINLNEVPVLNVEPTTETIVATEEKSEKKQFNCNKCNKAFTNKKTCMKHAQSHDSDKRLGGASHQCSFCGKNFKKHSDLIRHIRTHTGEKPFACDKCEKKFSLKSTLLSHQRTHNPVLPKQFSCVVCNSFFTSKSSLKVHMTVHTGDKTHKCNFCPMKFRTAAHRKSHENSYHLNPSKKRTKNKVTTLLESVAMDVLNHDQGETLDNVLVVQEQMQLSGDQLNLLSTEANQLEPLILQQLQSNFLLQDNLIQLDDGTLLNVKPIGNEDHNVAAIEKPRNLECDICHKKYASKDVLRKHRKIHGIDKKFRCTKCERGFDNEEELELHEKTHEGFRPYSCLYCANSFSREHSLGTHLKRIHNASLKDNLFLSIE